MSYYNDDHYPIQRKQPEELTLEQRLINGIINDIIIIILSRGLEYVGSKLSNWYSEWRVKFRRWLVENWNL